MQNQYEGKTPRGSFALIAWAVAVMPEHFRCHLARFKQLFKLSLVFLWCTSCKWPRYWCGRGGTSFQRGGASFTGVSRSPSEGHMLLCAALYPKRFDAWDHSTRSRRLMMTCFPWRCTLTWRGGLWFPYDLKKYAVWSLVLLPGTTMPDWSAEEGPGKTVPLSFRLGISSGANNPCPVKIQMLPETEGERLPSTRRLQVPRC